MSCPTVSTASGIMACWPVRHERPPSQRSAHYFASSSLNRPSRQSHRPRSSRSPCESHAPAAAAPCALSRYSGAARFPDPAHHPERPPHDQEHVTNPRSYPELQHVQGWYQCANNRICHVRPINIACKTPCKTSERSSIQGQRRTASTSWATLG